MSEEKPMIRCAENGPYLVKELKTLRNSRGEELEIKKIVALCRCGHSANKPFCDGAHAKNNFSGAREREQQPTTEADRYKGASIEILDNRTVCAHIGRCTQGQPTVWRLGRPSEEPWIDPDGAERDDVIAAIRTCPSGALSFSGDPGSDLKPQITVLKDGPYHVSGGIGLDDSTTGQSPYDPSQYTLCRCGASKNKPFCDGSHWNIKFKDNDN